MNYITSLAFFDELEKIAKIRAKTFGELLADKPWKKPLRELVKKLKKKPKQPKGFSNWALEA